MSKKYELHYGLSSTWRLSESGYEIAELRFREHRIKIEGCTPKSWDCRDKHQCIFNDFIMLGDENNGQEREDNNRTNA